jgi:hypothetical protein
VADGPGGLARGFAWSAAALALGAVLAAFQRPVGPGADAGTDRAAGRGP